MRVDYFIKIILIVALSGFSFYSTVYSETHTPLDNETALNSHIEQKMAQYHLPGVAVGIVKNDSLIFTKGYGWADMDNRVKVTDTTIFSIASISKTFTGVALMQLYEEGLFDLHDPINDYLSIEIFNPNHPEVEITFFQLLTHTSGLSDNNDVMNETYVVGDSPIELGQYMLDYFVPGGIYYDSVENFRPLAAGTAWDYSNHGITLAAYMVQAISGQSFEEYCRDHFFTPMAMTKTSWFLEGVELSNLAIRYWWDGNYNQPQPHKGYADWPAGQMRTNVHDLSKHLIAQLNWGEYDGYQLLDSSSVAAMTTLQVPGQTGFMGLTWFLEKATPYYIWNHSGRGTGIATRAGFRLTDSTAAVVLTNGSSSVAATSIFGALFNYALNYPFIDSDGDGAYDPTDNCPELSNPDQADSDSDGLGDLCDICPDDRLNDPDFDGVCNSLDNCPSIFNPDQFDSNNDGIGDRCCCGLFTAGITGNVDCSADGKMNLADITLLIDRVYISKAVLCCESGGNINGDQEQKINLADITRLIDHVYISKAATEACL